MTDRSLALLASSAPNPAALTDRCGRPTKHGTACTLHRLKGWLLPFGTVLPRSCLAHLTVDERAEYDAAVSAARQRHEAADAAFFDSEPACWSWANMPDPATWHWEPEAYLAGRSADIIADARGDAMIRAWQDGRCAICDRREHLIEDHDHVTGLVRGYLCRGCNIREGVYHGAASPFGRYRERHPASMLGLRMVYYGPFHEGGARPQPEPQSDGWTDNVLNGLL